MAADRLIRVSGLRKTFGNRRVLDGLNLDVYGGEAVAVLGVNGAGKTTLLKILAPVVRPTRGIAIVAGHDCAKDAEHVRRDIRLVAHGSHPSAGLAPPPQLGVLGALARVRASP